MGRVFETNAQRKNIVHCPAGNAVVLLHLSACSNVCVPAKAVSCPLLPPTHLLPALGCERCIKHCRV
jgi:hypothetical protein